MAREARVGPLEVGEGQGGQSEPSRGRSGPFGGLKGLGRPEWALWRSERAREARLSPLEVGEGPLEVGEGQGGENGPSGGRREAGRPE